MNTALYWLKGLLAAFIGGAANSVSVMIVDPIAFNLNEGLQKVLTVALVSGIVSAALYLKQSPLPNGGSNASIFKPNTDIPNTVA